MIAFKEIKPKMATETFDIQCKELAADNTDGDHTCSQHSCSVRTVRTLRLWKSSRTLWNFITDMKHYGTIRVVEFYILLCLA